MVASRHAKSIGGTYVIGLKEVCLLRERTGHQRTCGAQMGVPACGHPEDHGRVPPSSWEPTNYRRLIQDRLGGLTVIGPTFNGMTAGVANIKVEAVCGGCNNGWMLKLEDEAIPFLSRLIEGQDTGLIL